MMTRMHVLQHYRQTASCRLAREKANSTSSGSATCLCPHNLRFRLVARAPPVQPLSVLQVLQA